MRRLPVFNWITPSFADMKKADGLYDENFMVIGIDPRLGDKKVLKAIIHEMLHYWSDTYPKLVRKMKEKDVELFTKKILKLIKTN